jgi:hypothetical protein
MPSTMAETVDAVITQDSSAAARRMPRPGRRGFGFVMIGLRGQGWCKVRAPMLAGAHSKVLKRREPQPQTG